MIVYDPIVRALCFLPLAGCSLLIDADKLKGTGVDASADAADAGPMNLVQNSSFETGTIGCGPGWGQQSATISLVTDARTGAKACKVCRTTLDDFALVQTTMTTDIPPNSRFQVGASIRVESGSVSGAFVHLHTYDGSGTDTNGTWGGFPISITPNWAEYGQEIARAPAVKKMEVRIYFTAATPTCVLVDDVQAYAQ